MYICVYYYDGNDVCSDYDVVRGKLAKCGSKRVGARRFASQDVFVPWHPRDGSPTLGRYYHVFVEGELAELVASVEEARVDKTMYHADNWVVIGTRK